ncbi:hypothetical protein J6590_044380 [Homalodisca vitripennis]|nr:hypothetical protein J6590_044380 [Homalodisca vitripennis]
MLTKLHHFYRSHNIQTVLYRNGKRFSSSSPLKNVQHRCTEIRIPVPWGHVAGKWWGRQDVQPVLALHGVQDNAATFDKLVPMLEVDAVLALDIPGHGWSSHLPQGFPYDFMDAVSLMRFVIRHYYKWEKPMVLLSHSFGSNLSFVYSAVYPEEVSKFISIDCARHQMFVLPGTTVSSMRNTMDKILKYEESLNPPEYSYEGLLEMLYKGRRGLISKKGCEILLSRGMSTLENGNVCLSRDVRVKLNAFGRLTEESLLKLSGRIKCDVLSIQAENGTVHNNYKGEVFKKTVEIILKNSPKSKHIIMAGNHHLHLDDPEPVAKEINKFLL